MAGNHVLVPASPGLVELTDVLVPVAALDYGNVLDRFLATGGDVNLDSIKSFYGKALVMMGDAFEAVQGGKLGVVNGIDFTDDGGAFVVNGNSVRKPASTVHTVALDSDELVVLHAGEKPVVVAIALAKRAVYENFMICHNGLLGCGANIAKFGSKQ